MALWLNVVSCSNLFGLGLCELRALFESLKAPDYVASQVYQWLYRRKVWDISSWTDLPKALRRLLINGGYSCSTLTPENFQRSQDGTVKYLFRLRDDSFVESVLIPERKRLTLCVSSQVGCSHACFFCATARQGLRRNLSCGEILGQYVSLSKNHEITNIVYMGMGEPFSNWEAVKQSLNILRNPLGLKFSGKRITVSTVGVFPPLKEFVENTPCHLALSLHSPFPEERKRLMPIETVYPVEEIIAYLKKVSLTKPFYRFSVEYIVFKGINHSVHHARALVKLLHGLKVRVNLIPYHPISHTKLLAANNTEMRLFQTQLLDKGLTTTIRRSRGLDIDAACGMLSTKKLQEETSKNRLSDY